MVAVITGASSGIGQATALRLAKSGIDVVLAARRLALLEEVADQCRGYGVRALPVEVDVSEADEVEFLAKAATDEFGGYDVWINNAAVTIVGQFTAIPSDMFRKVIETNLFGYVYGAQAALKQFQVQGRGTLINVASVYGMVAGPYESPYIASKFAIRGFSAALRQELALARQQDIHVCTILPATIDTPMYRNAANITEREVMPLPPIYPASRVADGVMQLLEMPQAELIIGQAGYVAGGAQALMPQGVFEQLFGRYVDTRHFTGKKTAVTAGNLFVPGGHESVGGNWPQPSVNRKKMYTGVGVAAGVGLLWWLAQRGKRSGRS